jgi:hypothetical protein
MQLTHTLATATATATTTIAALTALLKIHGLLSLYCTPQYSMAVLSVQELHYLHYSDCHQLCVLSLLLAAMRSLIPVQHLQ